MMNDWDVTVIGAGLGGLTCAAYLAAAGRRVLVLEQHDIAGGNSHVFRRRGRFEFDVGVHYIGDCGPDGIVPAILGGLGVRDRVRFRQLNPDCFDHILLPGIAVRVPADWAAYGARISAARPRDAAGVATCITVLRAVATEQRAALLAPPGRSTADLLAATPMTRQWGRRSLTELFDHCRLSAATRTIFAAQSPNYGLGPDDVPVSAHANVTGHYLRGAYFPVGGGQMLAATLIEVIQGNGGTVATKRRVGRILVEDGRALGVRLTDGTVCRSGAVVSNADYRRTMLELVDPVLLGAAARHRLGSARTGLPFATAYVVSRRELDTDEANIWWYGTTDIHQYYRALAAGRQPDEPEFLFISFNSRKDPHQTHMCPRGYANFQLMTLCPPTYRPWGVDSGPADGTAYRRLGDYRAEKARFTDAMLTAAERVLGPFRNDIVHLEFASPLTQERYTRSTGGTPFGLAGWGRQRTRPDVRTAIADLFVVGQSTRYGSGVAGVMIGGVAGAAAVLDRPLLHEIYNLGTVFGDRSGLPPRPSDWDAFLFSRTYRSSSTRRLSRER